MLRIPCGVFYDDYPLFSPKELADNADECASALLDVLGWKHARTGPKGKPFDSSFDVLGCKLNLGEISTGTVVLENKPGRLNRLQEHLLKIKAAGRMSLHEAQVLHGLLRYSCGFFAGRLLHQVCAEVMALACNKANSRMKDLGGSCDYAAATLANCKPRSLSAFSEKRPVIIFTDGAWETGKAGIGAVIVDTATNQRLVLAGLVPAVLLNSWKTLVGDQLICHIELYTMVVVRWMLRDTPKDRRSIWWVDNDAARYAVIKGISPSYTMRLLVREFYAFEETHPTCSWVERALLFLPRFVRTSCWLAEPQRFSIAVSNPLYLPKRLMEHVGFARELQSQSVHAFAAGEDGLGAYEELAQNLPQVLRDGAVVVMGHLMWLWDPVGDDDPWN
eukprot:s3081_g5.t1